MPRFDPLPPPRFDQSLPNYLSTSFDRLRRAIGGIDAQLNFKPAIGEILAHETLLNGAGYRDLTTPGPAVTLKTGSEVMVIIHAQMGVPAGCDSRMGYAVSGTTTLAVSDDDLLFFAVAGSFAVSAMCRTSGLTPGTNTFTAKYYSSGGDTGFLRRRIAVYPVK